MQIDVLLGVFRALLRIGTLEADIGRNRIATIDLTDLMERHFQVYLPAAEGNGHQLSALIAPGISGPADREILTQAATNLIENAMFHNPAGTAITFVVGTESRQDCDRCGRSPDHGSGVQHTERANVLTSFYRLDPTRGGGDAGLGLSLVAAIADIHGAKLTDGQLPSPTRRTTP